MSRVVFRSLFFWLAATTFLLSQSSDPSKNSTPAPPPVSDVDTLAQAAELYSQGNSAAALEKYQRLLPTHPKWPKIYAGMAQVYLRQGNVQQADDVISKGVQQADSPAVRIALGEVYFREGKIFEAEQEWAKVINAGNEEARAYLGMARVSHANSMYKRYKTLIDKAFELDPGDPDIQRSWMRTRSRKERIKNLEGELLQTDEKSENRAYLQHALDSLRFPDRESCRLLGNVTSTETPLVRLMKDADNPRGVGLAVAVEGAKSKLMFDTGASGILIDQRVADKAGITKIANTQIWGIGDQSGQNGYTGIAKSIKIGELEFRNCPVEVIENHSVLSDDGLIGADVFEQFLVEIDVPGGKLRLTQLPQRPDEEAVPLGLNANNNNIEDDESGGDEPHAADRASATSLNSPSIKRTGPQDRFIAPEMKAYTRVFRFGHELLIPTKIGEVPPKLLLVDTGSGDTNISPEAAREVTKIHGEAFDRVKGLSGEVKKVYEAETVNFQFGRIRQKVRNVTTFDLSRLSQSIGTETSGILGFSTLEYLDIKIDYRDGLMDFDFTTAPVNRPGCGPASYPCQ